MKPRNINIEAIEKKTNDSKMVRFDDAERWSDLCPDQ